MACAIEDAGFEIRDCIQWLYGCLDEATEVLTNNGWKKYFELSPEDEVLQWDSKTSELSWTKPSKIHTYPYEGKMYHFANRHTDQLLTPNHRIYGKFRRHSRSPKPDVFEVVEAQHIKQHWQKDLPVAGLYKGSKHVDESYAYLVGWWLTDAWAHQDGKACMFSQSKPDTLLKLREALSKFDCSFSEYTKAPRKDTHNAEHTFYVTGSLANKLLDEFSTRELNISMLEWDIDSRKALLEGLLDGDGTYRDSQHCVVFWSKKKERLDLVQLLAMSLNYRTLIDYKKGCVHINPKTNTTQLQHRHTHDVVDYKGDVWCVTVPKGAFVVRRNGKVFITGNSGFPKSHDISKAIDKNLGAKRDVIGVSKGAGKNPKGFKFDDKSQSGGHLKSEYNLTTPATPEAKQWSGWGTCLKPSNEPIVLARKPISEKTIAENVMKWGTGGLNIDGCRVGNEELVYSPKGIRPGQGNYVGDNYKPNNPNTTVQGRFPANVILDEEAGALLDQQSGSISYGNKPGGYSYSDRQYAVQGFIKDCKPKAPSNYGDSGGASRFFKNIDYTREESDWLKSQSFAFNVGKSLETMLVIIESFAPESVMQNLKKLLETSVDDAENQLKTTDIDIALRDVVILPNQEDKALNDIILHFMSEMLKALKKKGDANMRQIQNIVSKLEPELRHTLMEKLKCNPVNYADVSLLTNIMMIIQSLLTTDGCAEGVMLTTIKNNMVAGGEDYEEPTRFKYCAKASKKERGEGNNHPTVKPVKLIEYLITLITPPNGIVLDPFFGSGTTGIAAVNLGFNYIGIELDEQYVEIARRRIGGAE
jgi:hypothetical protein